jgi:tRNA modification GTPase
MLDFSETPVAALACCVLTPAGRGAVAVIGLAGDHDSLAGAINRRFTPVGSRPFEQIKKQSIVYGVWRSTQEDLVVLRTPNGYEIHCHGGNAASSAIVEDLAAAGICELAQNRWQTLHDSPWTAETNSALSQATTDRSAKIILQLKQLQNQALSDLKSSIESKKLQSATDQIESMLAWSQFGQLLNRPRSVVFCGQPNVGKSSLVNAIVGFQRAIVNAKAGTTRDVVSQLTAIDGWMVDLKDTAGLRSSDETIESIGIEKAKLEIESAHLRVAVFDATIEFGETDRQLIADVCPELVVFNKSDLAPDFTPPEELGGVPNRCLTISATAKDGISDLIASIGESLVPTLPPRDQWFPLSPSQHQTLDRIHWLISNDRAAEAEPLLHS